MTHQRAIEAMARAIRAERGLYGKPSITSIQQAEAALTAYKAHLAAEGLVVVPARPNYDMGEAGMGALASFHDEHPAACVDEIYSAMIATAQQEQNDAKR